MIYLYGKTMIGYIFQKKTDDIRKFKIHIHVA